MVAAEAYAGSGLKGVTPSEVSMLSLYHDTAISLSLTCNIDSITARRYLTRLGLQLCSPDLPPELPSVLLRSLHLRGGPQCLLETLTCLKAYLLSSLEEQAAEVLWEGVWGCKPCPRMLMPHARRSEASYEEHIQDTIDAYKAATSSETLSSGLDMMTLLSRWSRCDAAVEVSEIERYTVHTICCHDDDDDNNNVALISI
jgi:hypothetical protein